MNMARMSLCGAVLWLASTACWAAEPAPSVDWEGLKPRGTRYEAVVPDTLDLAERARLAVHGLTSFLNDGADYAPYGHTYFNADPPYMSDMPGGPPNWGKIAESLVKARLMCGSEENLDIDAKMLDGMLRSPWMTVNPVAPTPVSRGMLALMAAYQVNPSAELKRVIDAMAEEHVRVAKHAEDYAYYYDAPPDERETALGELGYGLEVFIHGSAIRPLAQWSMLADEPEYLDLSGELATFLLQPKFWAAEAAPKAVCAEDRGHFSGHHHSYTQALLGLLWYADVVHDVRIKQFVRDSYEYMRNFGIARLGLFGEACTTGDMTLLAIKLSDAGMGDYWEDADQYARNHLAELQITDAGRLRRTTSTMPKGRGKFDTTQGPFDPANETHENVIERNVGVFLSDATHPTLIPEHGLLYTICCTGNCTPALYAVWEATIRHKDGTVQVNLLLNRASPWLDLDSHLPYEGKVVLHNKTARRVAVRIPRWVRKSEVSSRVNDEAGAPFWVARYLVFESLKGEDAVTITFPVTETTEHYTLKWKQSEFWKESTNPGDSWQPPEKPVRYACRFRGNTLVDIAPRQPGPGYPLYLRSHLKPGRAPEKKVTRYIPPIVVRW